MNEAQELCEHALLDHDRQSFSGMQCHDCQHAMLYHMKLQFYSYTLLEGYRYIQHCRIAQGQIHEGPEATKIAGIK